MAKRRVRLTAASDAVPDLLLPDPDAERTHLPHSDRPRTSLEGFRTWILWRHSDRADRGIMHVIVARLMLLRMGVGWVGPSSPVIVCRCLSVSTSFMLASLRVLHVDASGAPA